MTDLQAAIEDLYTAFAGYVRPPTFVGCICCWDGAERPDGQSRDVPSPGGPRPLRSLNATELADVASQVPHLGGSTELLKHYLPRILEICTIGGGFDWPDIEEVVGHLTYGDGEDRWTAWPEDERGAVRGVLHAMWRDVLTAEVDDEATLDGTFCSVGIADPDIDWYLDTWLRFEHPNAAGHLERFLTENSRRMHKGKLVNAFWFTDQPPAPENRRRIIAWTKAGSTLAAVAAAADRARTPAERESLEECYLRWLG